jgi:hypothetical protein
MNFGVEPAVAKCVIIPPDCSLRLPRILCEAPNLTNVALRGFDLGSCDLKIVYQRSKRGPLPRSSNFADVDDDVDVEEGAAAEAMTVWVTVMMTPSAF